jgi:two-component system nitrogen regulation sensor histidine kinase NtrY
MLNCDSAQFNRAITNLLQNAADAIEGRLEDQRQEQGEGAELEPGAIHLWIRDTGNGIAVGVDDNGRGLPKQGRERLTEPYVTTRTKGTGLGLAIVKKIMEDHGGRLILADREGGGASVHLLFPVESVVMVPARITGFGRLPDLNEPDGAWSCDAAVTEETGLDDGQGIRGPWHATS